MASKRILSFQTPRKKAQTPLRVAKKPPVAKQEDPSLENKLIEAYRAENTTLRSLCADTLLYQRLLGVAIKERGTGNFGFVIERESSTGTRKLVFNLEEKEDVFICTLEDSINCNIPEYFYHVIEFEKKAFSMFFYKAMQAVHEARTN